MLRFFILFAFAFNSVSAYSQNIDLMMQAWYWDYFQGGNFGNWVNQLNGKTTELKNAGFKHIWLPPLPRTSTPNNQSNGYNPMDLYDLGETYGGGACAWGTRAQLNTLIANYNANNMVAVSDVVYNHRDGGKPERNNAVKTYITTGPNQSASPYPSDRFFCVLPIGSSNPGNYGAGDYYLKIRSRSQGYSSNSYKIYVKTRNTAYIPGVLSESEPNGGGECGQPSNDLPLGKDMVAQLGDYNGCHIDEFKVTLNSGNFIATDDTLFIYLTNYNSGYSDHYVYGLWYAPGSIDISNNVEYWTYSDYNNLPSGQGACNYNAFRPNDNTANSEDLGCDWNCPLFFYDYDQSQTVTQTLLNEWSKWQIQQVGLKGLRMDAVKHFSRDFVSELFNYLQTQNALPEIAVGEFFDFSASALNDWVEDVYDGMTPAAQAALKPRIFDFAMRGALKNACDQFGYDVRNVFNSGMVDGVGADPFKVVTFINNHDFRGPGEPLQNDAYLAYAYILTNNQIGAPCVFYPDYYGVSIPNAPVNNYKLRINDLVSLHQDYIYGSTEIDYLSRFSTPYYQSFLSGLNSTTLIYQIKPNGSNKNVIVAINFAGTALDVYQGVREDWGVTSGETFTDMLGYSGNTFTTIVGPSGNPQIHVTLPSRSYTVYVEGTNTPLPVELLDFSAASIGKVVQLSWRTATERNFDRYEIERAVGADWQFSVIGSVAGAGQDQRYSFTDETAPANVPLYYRLKMLDRDGTFAYSDARQVLIEQRSFNAFVAPNPTPGQASVYLSNEKSQAFLLSVYNSLGQLAYEQTIELEAGEAALPLPDVAAGMYRVTLQGERETLQMNWIKQ